MKVIKLILFLEINTLALLIVPCLAGSLPYFCKDMDLCLAYNMEEGTMESIQIEYLNLINLISVDVCFQEHGEVSGGKRACA